jgi:hypothetical protein
MKPISSSEDEPQNNVRQNLNLLQLLGPSELRRWKRFSRCHLFSRNSWIMDLDRDACAKLLRENWDGCRDLAKQRLRLLRLRRHSLAHLTLLPDPEP